MSNVPRPIDDYALAAFIVGKVPGKVRQQILDSLCDEHDARRVLLLVYDALTTGGKPDDAMRFIADRWRPAA